MRFLDEPREVQEILDRTGYASYAGAFSRLRIAAEATGTTLHNGRVIRDGKPRMVHATSREAIEREQRGGAYDAKGLFQALSEPLTRAEIIDRFDVTPARLGRLLRSAGGYGEIHEAHAGGSRVYGTDREAVEERASRIRAQDARARHKDLLEHVRSPRTIPEIQRRYGYASPGGALTALLRASQSSGAPLYKARVAMEGGPVMTYCADPGPLDDGARGPVQAGFRVHEVTHA